ncbi:hypothetical protein N644_1190 [Lactiplantibacillus paraplantarum]|nr:hypothetical protein N644_1190 [Lactiplantibacillus paraplantarum]
MQKWQLNQSPFPLSHRYIRQVVDGKLPKISVVYFWQQIAYTQKQQLA